MEAVEVETPSRHWDFPADVSQSAELQARLLVEQYVDANMDFRREMRAKLRAHHKLGTHSVFRARLCEKLAAGKLTPHAAFTLDAEFPWVEKFVRLDFENDAQARRALIAHLANNFFD
jgi:hypothetical protein